MREREMARQQQAMQATGAGGGGGGQTYYQCKSTLQVELMIYFACLVP